MPTTIEKHLTEEKPLVEEVGQLPPVFRDSDEVTVLFGYGKEPAHKVCYIDNVKFTGGVAHDVRYSIVRGWEEGLRPDGKPSLSRITMQAVFPQKKEKDEVTGKTLLTSPTEVDYVLATGIKEGISDAHLAAMVRSLNVDHLIKMLTPEQTKALATRLQGGR